MFVHDALNKVSARANRWGEDKGALVIWLFAYFSSSIYLEVHSRDAAAEHAVKKIIQHLDKAADERLDLFYICVGTFSTPSD